METATWEDQAERNSDEHQTDFYSESIFSSREDIEAQAWLLIRNRERFESAAIKQEEWRDNARTALMEALTASGHLSKVEITGSLEEINHQVLSRLLNGWDDSLPIHEKHRRFGELCNELFIQEVHRAIAAGERQPDTSVAEISDYPAALSDSLAQSLGYRAKNHKGMVRSTHLEYLGDGQYKRLIEQVSRSHSSDGSSLAFLAESEISISDKPADIAVLDAPFIYQAHTVRDGVVDIIARLDMHAGGAAYGDFAPRSEAQLPYEELRQGSAGREKAILHYVDGLARLEQQLEFMENSGQIPKEERLEIYKEEINRILSAVCTLNPDFAEDTFGSRAAVKFREAAQLVLRGQDALAGQILAEAEYLKETVVFCGISITVEQARQKGLKVNPFTRLLELGKENWFKKKARCLVGNCPTKPRQVKVGPCNVCERCQLLYDDKKDPKKIYKTAAEKKQRQQREKAQRAQRQAKQIGRAAVIAKAKP